MTMKHLLAVLCLAGAAMLQAEDFQYLYWQVNQDSSIGEPAFSYATVSQNGTKLNFVGTDGSSYGTEMAADNWNSFGDTGLTAGPLYTGLSGTYSDSDNFLFELWLDGGETALGSVSYTYSELLNGKYIYQAMASGGGHTPLTVHVVPEPSSALLLLLGMGALALKRQRV